MKEKLKRHASLHKKIAVVLIIISALMLFLGPFDSVKTEFSDKAPLLLIGLFFTEILFIVGILIMATVASYDLGKNPLKWKSQFHNLPHAIISQRLFWIGFWINAVGAIGTGLLILWGVIYILPARSWGLAYLGIFDISLTILVRAEILKLKSISE